MGALLFSGSNHEFNQPKTILAEQSSPINLPIITKQISLLVISNLISLTLYFFLIKIPFHVIQIMAGVKYFERQMKPNRRELLYDEFRNIHFN